MIWGAEAVKLGLLVVGLIDTVIFCAVWTAPVTPLGAMLPIPCVENSLISKLPDKELLSQVVVTPLM